MRPRTLAVMALTAVLATLALGAAASAHGRVCLQADGTQLDRGGHGRPGPTGATGDCPDADLVEFAIGWVGEPVFVGEVTGLDLGLRLPADNTPVANVTTLMGQYEFGGQVFPLDIEPQFNRPGWYTDDIAPSRPGSYTLRIWGSVNTSQGVKTLNFTHQPAVVEPLSDIAFPKAEAGGVEGKVAALEQQVQALRRDVDSLRATPSRNGMVQADGNATPGFEPLLAALAGVAVAVLASRRRGVR